MGMTYITIYTETLDVIDELTDDEAGRLLKGLLHHAVGDDVALCGDERMVYKLMVKAIDAHAKHYAEVCDKRRDAANNRWERGNPPESQMQMDANACNCMQMHTNEYKCIQMDTIALKDKDKDKDKVEVKDKDKIKVEDKG